MRVLITWGSKRGGTEGIARMLGEALEAEGIEVAMVAAGDVRDLAGFEAVVVGGALYANRWHRAARRFVHRHVAALRRVPVWMFSSGPLDDSADRGVIPPTTDVAALMERVGALGHATFGGRLAPDASGFPARAMARTHGGDWRNRERIRTWASDLARRLPSARPGIPIDHPARSVSRLTAHALVGWAACAATMAALLRVTTTDLAIVLHALAAPAIFTVIAWRYFRPRGARDAAPTALAFAGISALLDLVVVAGIVQHSLAMFGGIAGTWLPLALIAVATWATGALMSTRPWPRPPRPGHATQPTAPAKSG